MGGRQSPDTLCKDREHQRAKMSCMLNRTVKGLELVQITTPFLEMFLPLLLGTLEIPVLLTTHTLYENSDYHGSPQPTTDRNIK